MEIQSLIYRGNVLIGEKREFLEVKVLQTRTADLKSSTGGLACSCSAYFLSGNKLTSKEEHRK